MYRVFVIFLLLGVSFTDSVPEDGEFLYGTFPDGFVWSTATSSYQIEGGWNASGKGENIWDRFSHVGNNIANNDTGDVACDSYHKYPEDIQLMKDLGVHMYRFSISWARIFPDGTKGSIEARGIEYYSTLITELQAAGIEPMVTLYHWDLPQALMDVGGWQNETIIPHFVDYAEECFKSFGDRVKFWITFNEPFVVSWVGHGIGAHAPGIKEPGTAPYRVAHTIIKSHAKAWHLYHDNYRATQKGNISITLDTDWKEPRDKTNPSDVAAAERALLFKFGWFAHPIFLTGDYPEVMKERVANKSIIQGLNESRLPAFTEEEKMEIRGTHDFFGLNHYTTQYIIDKDRGIVPNYENDQDIEEWRDPSWPTTGTGWLRPVPWGFRKILKYIKDTYNNPAIYVTENGVSDKCLCLEDTDRTEYYRNYTNQMLKAIKIDNVNVAGYTAWSLLDNFEWDSGYGQRFGLHYVNFTDPNRTRIPKESTKFFKKLVMDNGYPQGPSGGAADAYSSSKLAVTCVILISIWATLFRLG